MKKPFKKKEEKVMNLLIKAHNEFLKLKRTHPSELQEWIAGIHQVQNTLIQRILRRDYPQYLTSKNN